MSPPDGLTAALAALSARMHDLAPGQHSVTSALGLWLVLATAAGNAAPAQSRELEAVLGLPKDDSGELARALLTRPHPAVSAALALWADADFETPDLQRWSSDVASYAEVGPLPSQDAADEWARESTRGLIERFPVAIDPDTMLVLASALAARVTWAQPFHVVDAATAPGAWPADVTAVLRSPRSTRRFIVGDPMSGIGDVAVHEARSSGMSVVSVAAGPDRERGAVLMAAHRIAAALGRASSSAHELGIRSLFDLELGNHSCWDLREERGVVSSPSGREEVVEAFLPAWQASTQVDLGAAPGVSAAANALVELLRPHPAGSTFGAIQAAHAEYTRTGFSAAAVTALALTAGAVPPSRPGTIRTAALHFDLPHAVVATALDDRSQAERDDVADPWDGLPVFSAWITQAVDAT